MNFNKVDGVLQFEDYKSFFKFVNNYDGDLRIVKYNVYSGEDLIAMFNHKSK